MHFEVELEVAYCTVKPALVTTCIQKTTSIQRPLGHVPIVALPCIFTSIQRPPLFKDHLFWAQAWPLNTGFTVYKFKIVFFSLHAYLPVLSYLPKVKLSGFVSFFSLYIIIDPCKLCAQGREGDELTNLVHLVAVSDHVSDAEFRGILDQIYKQEGYVLIIMNEILFCDPR